MRRGKYQHPKAPAMNFAILMAFVLFWLVMVTTYLSVGLFAKYSTRGSGHDKAQVISFNELVVTETGDGIKQDNGSRKFVFSPGVNIKKDITVSFGGSESDTFVFIELDTPGWTQDKENKHAFSLTQGEATFMSWEVDPAWKHLTSENKHVYYMPLKANEKLAPQDVLLKVNPENSEDYYQIYVSADATQANYADLVTRNNDIKINVTAHVVQANGFYNSKNMDENAASAWKSLNR